MRRLFSCAALVAAVVLSTGCSRWGISTPPALIYSNTTTPFAGRGGPRTGGPPKPVIVSDDLIVSTGVVHRIELNIPFVEWSRFIGVGWGDAGLENVMAKGGIGEMMYADGQVIEVLRIYTQSRMIVYGLPEGAEESPAGPGGPPPGVGAPGGTRPGSEGEQPPVTNN